MLGYTLHLVSSHYTAGWRKQSGNAWENGGKRRKKQGTKKEREKSRTDTDMTVHSATRKKRKTVIMQSWERAAFVPLDVSFCDRKRIFYGNNRMA